MIEQLVFVSCLLLW